MREIKFRAWDDKEKKWLLGYEYPNLGGFSMFGECMLFGEWTGILNSRPLQELDTVRLMQYTGLKDKNGKEIYEGDIIRFVHDKEDWFNQIGFEDGSFVRFFDNGTSTPINQDSMSQAIIIGNIYENPELLNN